MKTRSTLCLSLLLPLLAGPVQAHRGSGPGGPFGPNYDLDGDGRVTREEIRTARAREFVEMDADHDGSASIAEVKTWLEQQQTSGFNKLDADQSGTLSQAEFVANQKGRRARLANKAFKFLDGDGDGALSLAEFRAGRPAAMELTRLFDHHDLNDDDQLSEDEYLTPPPMAAGGPGSGGRGRPPFH